MNSLKFRRFDFSGCTGKRSCTSNSVHHVLCPKLRADLVRFKEDRRQFEASRRTKQLY